MLAARDTLFSLLPIVFFGGFFVTVIVTTRIRQSAKIKLEKMKMQNDLKIRLVELGLSADEIERLVDLDIDDRSAETFENDGYKFNKPKPPIKS